MIVEFHGMKCRCRTYRTNGADKNILTLLNAKDWEKSLQYDFTEPQYGLWCHFLTEEEMKSLFSEQNGSLYIDVEICWDYKTGV